MSRNRCKRKNNKKMLLGILLLLISVTIVITSSFALFSDAGAVLVNAKAGTLDLVVKDKTRTQYFTVGETERNISYENDIDNINPGDIIDTGFTVTNEGSKSAVVKTNIIFKVKARNNLDDFMFYVFPYYEDAPETQRETIRGGIFDRALELTFEGEDEETGELIYKYEMAGTDFKILNGKSDLPDTEIEEKRNRGIYSKIFNLL